MARRPSRDLSGPSTFAVGGNLPCTLHAPSGGNLEVSEKFPTQKGRCHVRHPAHESHLRSRGTHGSTPAPHVDRPVDGPDHVNLADRAASSRCSGSPSASRSCGRSSTSCSPSASPPAGPRTAPSDRFGDAAWIHGGSPTEGFLTFGADGPFKGFYHSIAGAAWADWLFMLGLLGIGLALTFGVGMRSRRRRRWRALPADVDRGRCPRRTTR